MSQKLAITQAVNKLNDKIGEFTITPARMMRMQNIVVDRIAFGRSAIDETSLSNMPTPFVG